MLLRTSLNNILDRLDHTRVIRQDTIVPGRWPPVANSPYRPGYDWLFGYERKLAKFLEPWLLDSRYELIGGNGILSEALSNAYCHGNRKKGASEIRVVVYLANQGLMVRIRDCGPGFNIEKTYRNLSRGKHYYHLAGNGLRLMMESQKFGIFFDEGGAAFYLLYLFSQDFSSFDCVVGRHGSAEKNQQTASGTEPVEKKPDLQIVPTVLPHTIDWVKSCILVDESRDYAVVFNVGKDLTTKLVTVCKDLCSRVDQFDTNLALGDTEHLTVFSEEESLFLKYYRDSSRLLIVVLNRDAIPALATMHYPQLVSHLSNFLPN